MKVIIFKKKQAIIICCTVIFMLMILFVGSGELVKNVAKTNSLLPVYSVEVAQEAQKVSLTINCAWGNEDIPEILNILKIHDVKATFFLVGDWAEKFPESVKLISEAEHEIGNHSMSHADFTKIPEEDIVAQLDEASDVIEEITGIRPMLFRAPSGAYNNLSIKTAMEQGYYCIQWDCDSLDWKGYTTEQMMENINKNLKYGSIMLFHNDTEYTKEALEVVITNLKSMDYELVTVGELIYKDNYRIDHTGRQFNLEGTSNESQLQ